LKSSQEDIELLDQYIKDRLTAEMKQTLETRLSRDADLRADLADLMVLKQGMRVRALEEKMNNMLGWETELNQRKKTGKKWWFWAGIIFLLLTGGYLLVQNTLNTENKVPEEYKKLYASDFRENLILHQTKRAITQPDDITPQQRRAYEMYSIQLFGEAIPLLDDLWNQKQDTLALFYLGVSYVGDGQKEKGISVLQKPELKKYSKQIDLFINH
jgi:hypothetical protein